MNSSPNIEPSNTSEPVQDTSVPVGVTPTKTKTGDSSSTLEVYTVVPKEPAHEAVLITEENLIEVVAWSGGQINFDIDRNQNEVLFPFADGSMGVARIGQWLVKLDEDSHVYFWIFDTAEDFRDTYRILQQDGNLVEHARRELELLGEEPRVIEWYLNVVREYASFGHSGGSAAATLPILYKLLSYDNLTEITNHPSEWIHHTEEKWGEPGGVWQNIRNGEAFSDDGGKTFTLLSERGPDNEDGPKHVSATRKPEGYDNFMHSLRHSYEITKDGFA